MGLFQVIKGILTHLSGFRIYWPMVETIGGLDKIHQPSVYSKLLEEIHKPLCSKLWVHKIIKYI